MLFNNPNYSTEVEPSNIDQFACYSFLSLLCTKKRAHDSTETRTVGRNTNICVLVPPIKELCFITITCHFLEKVEKKIGTYAAWITQYQSSQKKK